MFGKKTILGSTIAVLLAATAAPSSAEADAPLADAAMRGDVESVRSLLGRQVDVNAPQGDGTTALHWAAYQDDLEMAKLLIDAGADVDATTRVGDLIPIVMAAKNGNAAMIELLLEAGTDPTYADASVLVVGKCVTAQGEADTSGGYAATALVVSEPGDEGCSARTAVAGGQQRPDAGADR